MGSIDIKRRRTLSVLGLSAAALYVAPLLTKVGEARAEDDKSKKSTKSKKEKPEKEDDKKEDDKKDDDKKDD